MSYMILSLKDGDAAIKSFHIENDLVYEEYLRIVDEEKSEAAPANFSPDDGKLLSFDFTIAHEIKSPLRAIDGYARIFLEDFGGDLDPQGRVLIENIRSICRETISLADKLLEYTRIVQEGTDMAPVDLSAIIREVFASLRETDEDRSPAKLLFASPIPDVVGDSVLLHLAISNIISKSLKFTRNKDEAVITVGYEKKDGEHLFFFRDNGAGFDMQYSKKLFEMFQRMHGSDEFEGAGIGLVIVKKIILMHGGHIRITGEVGEGATVYFSLPEDKVRSPKGS
jgi:light-regulated signal transduction histidine kinase (bacteriophytochrome)